MATPRIQKWSSSSSFLYSTRHLKGNHRAQKWSSLPNAVFLLLLLLLLLQLPKSEAAFVGKESCGFDSSEILDVTSKMWIMSGPDPSEVSTSVGQKLYFPPHSVFKVITRKDNTTVIEAQHPHVMMYRLSNVSQLQIVSGQITVSCLNDRRRAERELGVAETATDTSSSEISSETDQSSTPLPADVTSTAMKHLRPRSFRSEDSSTNNSSSGMENAPSHHVEITTVNTTLPKETTKQTLITDKPITPNTTTTTTTTTTTPTTTTTKESTTSTTRKTPVETKPAVAITPFVVTETEEFSENEKETSPYFINIPTTPVVAFDNGIPKRATVPDTETSEAQTTTVISPLVESQSHSSMAVEPESSRAPFKVEDHIPYFAACGVLLLVTVLVAATICIVQRRRSRRRSLDNHEDLFITSTYDQMLLRNNENIDGRSSRLNMYGDEPVVLDPHELEVRILGDNAIISTNDDERPRCLGDE